MTSSSPAQDENWGWLRALWNRGWFLSLLLVATIIFVYQPVWHAGFIWDDDAHVTKPALRSLGGLASIWIRLGATQQYYPLVHSVFWVEHRLWGDSTVGYHLTNILLHAFSALLLVQDTAAIENTRGLAGGGHLCAASGSSGIGVVDFGAQEHAVGSILSGFSAGLSGI
jgi:hypothetical protein